MLQLKKLITYLSIGVWAAVLCACASNDGEIILIGEESPAGRSDVVREEECPEGLPDDGNETIRVYVCGAVVVPGVVEVPVDSRVENVLEAAGGFGENADCTYVNLAAWVADGQMIYFPTIEETCAGQLAWEQNRESGTGNFHTEDDELVNINTADAEKLCTLPGIGESRAADIVAYREANGFFETCEDIMRVPGIKDGLYEKIRSKITVK